MPWSAKAQSFSRRSTRRSGPQGRHPCRERSPRWRKPRGGCAVTKETRPSRSWALVGAAKEHVDKFVAAYRQYCWPVASVGRPEAGPLPPAGLGRPCPRGPEPHLAHGNAWCGLPEDPELLLATSYKLVDVTDPAREKEGVEWWDGPYRPRRRRHGGQAARIHPPGPAGAAQPAVEVPGREYLRIIYGQITRPRKISPDCGLVV